MTTYTKRIMLAASLLLLPALAHAAEGSLSAAPASQRSKSTTVGTSEVGAKTYMYALSSPVQLSSGRAMRTMTEESITGVLPGTVKTLLKNESWGLTESPIGISGNVYDSELATDGVMLGDIVYEGHSEVDNKSPGGASISLVRSKVPFSKTFFKKTISHSFFAGTVKLEGEIGLSGSVSLGAHSEVEYLDTRGMGLVGPPTVLGVISSSTESGAALVTKATAGVKILYGIVASAKMGLEVDVLRYTTSPVARGFWYNWEFLPKSTQNLYLSTVDGIAEASTGGGDAWMKACITLLCDTWTIADWSGKMIEDASFFEAENLEYAAQP